MTTITVKLHGESGKLLRAARRRKIEFCLGEIPRAKSATRYRRKSPRCSKTEKPVGHTFSGIWAKSSQRLAAKSSEAKRGRSWGWMLSLVVLLIVGRADASSFCFAISSAARTRHAEG